MKEVSFGCEWAEENLPREEGIGLSPSGGGNELDKELKRPTLVRGVVSIFFFAGKINVGDEI